MLLHPVLPPPRPSVHEAGAVEVVLVREPALVPRAHKHSFERHAQPPPPPRPHAAPRVPLPLCYHHPGHLVQQQGCGPVQPPPKDALPAPHRRHARSLLVPSVPWRRWQALRLRPLHRGRHGNGLVHQPAAVEHLRLRAGRCAAPAQRPVPAALLPLGANCVAAPSERQAVSQGGCRRGLHPHPRTHPLSAQPPPRCRSPRTGSRPRTSCARPGGTGRMRSCAGQSHGRLSAGTGHRAPTSHARVSNALERDGQLQGRTWGTSVPGTRR